MKKRIISVVLVVLMLLGICTVQISAQTPISVFVNGTEIYFDIQPQIIDDRTMVPMRKIFESLGATVSWNERKKTVTAKKGKTIVVMQVDNPIMTINEQEIELEVPPIILGGRTLVPVRAVAEGLGVDVLWYGDVRTVAIHNDSSKIAVADLYNPKGEKQSVEVCLIDKYRALGWTYNANDKPTEIADLMPRYAEYPMIPDMGLILNDSLIEKGYDESGNYTYLYQITDESKPLSVYTEAVKDVGYYLFQDVGGDSLTSFAMINDNLSYPTILITSFEQLGILMRSVSVVKLNTEQQLNKTEFYSGTPIKTYTSITGISLKNLSVSESGTVTYIYPFTHSGEHSEIVDYISYLLKDGWVEVKRSEEELGLIFVFKKDNNFIQIGYVGVLEEVWISAF